MAFLLTYHKPITTLNPFSDAACSKGPDTLQGGPGRAPSTWAYVLTMGRFSVCGSSCFKGVLGGLGDSLFKKSKSSSKSCRLLHDPSLKENLAFIISSST